MSKKKFLKKVITDSSIIEFGKYKGCMFGEIDAEYLMWLDNRPHTPANIQEYINKNKPLLLEEIKLKKYEE